MTGKQTSPSVTTLTQHPGTTLVGMLRMSLAVNVGVSTLTRGCIDLCNQTDEFTQHSHIAVLLEDNVMYKSHTEF